VKVLENKNIDTILDFQFIENESGLSFHSVDEVINLLDRLLLKLNEYELPLKSITLGEENIWHYPSVSSYSSSNKKSREDYFNEIYTILKVKYPNQSFLQWYSPVSHDKQRAP
jgi:hypothetical protein